MVLDCILSLAPPPPLLPPPLRKKMWPFLWELCPTYYDWLIGHASASFSNLIQIGERIEDGFKTRKIKDYQALFEEASRSNGGTSKRAFSNKIEMNEEEVRPISGHVPQKAPALTMSLLSSNYLFSM